MASTPGTAIQAPAARRQGASPQVADQLGITASPPHIPASSLVYLTMGYGAYFMYALTLCFVAAICQTLGKHLVNEHVQWSLFMCIYAYRLNNGRGHMVALQSRLWLRLYHVCLLVTILVHLQVPCHLHRCLEKMTAAGASGWPHPLPVAAGSTHPV